MCASNVRSIDRGKRVTKSRPASRTARARGARSRRARVAQCDARATMDARAIARLADAGAREARRAVRDGAVRRERTRDDARGGTTTTTMGREPRGNGAREGAREDDGEDGRGGGGVGNDGEWVRG